MTGAQDNILWQINKSGLTPESRTHYSKSPIGQQIPVGTPDRKYEWTVSMFQNWTEGILECHQLHGCLTREVGIKLSITRILKEINNEPDRRPLTSSEGPASSKMKHHLKCTLLHNLCTSPWAFCVICWDLNLLLLFNKSTAIKIGLQLCFHFPDGDITAWTFSAFSSVFSTFSCHIPVLDCCDQTGHRDSGAPPLKPWSQQVGPSAGSLTPGLSSSCSTRPISPYRRFISLI